MSLNINSGLVETGLLWICSYHPYHTGNDEIKELCARHYGRIYIYIYISCYVTISHLNTAFSSCIQTPYCKHREVHLCFWTVLSQVTPGKKETNLHRGGPGAAAGPLDSDKSFLCLWGIKALDQVCWRGMEKWPHTWWHFLYFFVCKSCLHLKANLLFKSLHLFFNIVRWPLSGYVKDEKRCPSGESEWSRIRF